MRSDLLLILAGAIWGLAFVAQRVAMDHTGPLTFNGVRFAIGAAALTPLLRVLSRRLGPGATRPASWRVDLRRGLVLGLFLTGGATLQQMGMVHTTAGKAGFITGLYVVLVPILGLLAGERTRRPTWLGALLAVAGLYLLSITSRLEMARGDLLVLAGAFFWAVHVLLVARWAPRTEPVRLAALQFTACALASLAGALLFEQPTWAGILAARWPILYAGVLSTGVAYTLQVVAQRHAPPAHAAIILSLEAVFAVLGGMAILGESLSARGFAGCALMLAGMILSQVALGPRRRPAP
ncbi:MAG TPA: DMT family transporter [Candidatus Krumholzibacteria bacterium]|nr:DMT family transporter [Candidatus Krumholzibacteria bacterium]HPD73097.1 DMT family transporter [Candidatus Krumholzibacteria bacterium]HRY41897.1 DMT family transporter [Candidatus Krumholzibacteria bacterium]